MCDYVLGVSLGVYVKVRLIRISCYYYNIGRKEKKLEIKRFETKKFKGDMYLCFFRCLGGLLFINFYLIYLF